MKFLFACTGTAGHINPALAIAEQLKKTVENSSFLFVGAGRDMEKRLIENAGYELVNIQMSGLRRSFKPKDIVYNLKAVSYLFKAGIEAKKIIKDFKPDAVIGTGGYICYPVIKEASKLGIPTIVHESNAVPGLTTKMLAKTASRVLVSFPGLENSYKRPENVVFTGTPIRGGFGQNVDKTRDKNQFGKPIVLSFWGSLGAEGMNEMMIAFMKANVEKSAFHHIHGAGKSGGDLEIQQGLMELGIGTEELSNLDIREYIDDMEAVMGLADLVLCRAGGSTIAELTALGKPAVLVPSPYVSNNEQHFNAEQLAKAGGALILDEKNCTGDMLFDIVVDILNDSDKLSSMAEGQMSIAAPMAAETITDLILSLCKDVY